MNFSLLKEKEDKDKADTAKPAATKDTKDTASKIAPPVKGWEPDSGRFGESQIATDHQLRKYFGLPVEQRWRKIIFHGPDGKRI